MGIGFHPDFTREPFVYAVHTYSSNRGANNKLVRMRWDGRALGAVNHTMICAIWHMLSTGETYRDLGGDYFTTRDPERQTRRLVKQLERLGHHVTLTQEAAAA